MRAKCCLLVVCLSQVAALNAAYGALTVSPGTIWGADSISLQLREYSYSGTFMGSLGITGLPGAYPTGVAVLGSHVFVSSNSGYIGEVNLNTGAVFNLFLGPASEALGDNGTNLLTYNYSTGVVREFSTTGTLLNTITLAGGAGMSGLDADGNRIFVTGWGNGNIREYNSTGALVNTVTTGLPTGFVSGLGYDSSDGSFWVSSGYGDDRIRQYSATGTLLANFSAGSPEINGLDVVPASAVVPEPAGIVVWSALAGTSAAVVVARSQRRRAARGRWTDENRSAILAIIDGGGKS